MEAGRLEGKGGDPDGPWVPGVRVNDPWTSVRLSSLVGRAGVDPARAALVLEGRVTSHAELSARSSRLARILMGELGVRPGERVSLCVRNCLEYLEIELAVAAAGAVFVGISWRYTASERNDILRRSAAAVLFASAECVEEVMDSRGEGLLPGLRRVVVLGSESASADERFDELMARRVRTTTLPATRMSDPHEIIYTSGTTGRPKGAVWTQGGVLWNSIQQAMDFGIDADSSTYVSFDLNYIGGRHQFTWALLYQGGTVHLRRSGGFSAHDVMEYVCREQITHVLWVPTMLHDILGLDHLSTFDSSHLRMVMCGGAPLSAETVMRAQDAFPHTRVVQVFGLTEGGGTVSFVPPRDLRRKAGSVGRASLHNEIRVACEDGSGCDPHTVGEVLVRGPVVTPGYWDDPAATAEAIRGGWLWTGDLGYLDDEGFLYLSGRRKELIISGGMNVFPSEVEDALRGHPAVHDVAVIGIPHERWGEAVCAVVEVRPGQAVTDEELVAFSRERLAGYKKPTTVRFMDELPRTPSGKVRKADLRTQVIAAG